MSDPSFQKGDIDIQFLERRTDLLNPTTSRERIHDIAIAAALAEDQARQSRRPPVIADGAAGGEWARQARSEGLR
jgi:hypothetical protein